jgi:hypothetical protein
LKDVKLLALIPFGIMLLVFINYLPRVAKDERLSRWKGGGFGMYSSMHPKQTQFVAFYKKEGVIQRDVISNDAHLSSASNYLSDKEIEYFKIKYQLMSKEKQLSYFRLEKWQPKIVVSDNYKYFFQWNQIYSYEN